MPKYEDFKVGDVWICRDGSKRTIVIVEPLMLSSGERTKFPIRAVSKSRAIWYRPDGTAGTNIAGHDLISKVDDEPESVPAPKILRDEFALEALGLHNGLD